MFESPGVEYIKKMNVLSSEMACSIHCRFGFYISQKERVDKIQE